MKSIVVKKYKYEREYEKDARKMQKRGYEVVNVVSKRPRPGVFRATTALMTGGVSNLLYKPPAELVVTYRLRR